MALVNVTTGRVRKVIRLPGAPRHLQLAGPARPVLVPAEQVDQLFQLALPSGQVFVAGTDDDQLQLIDPGTRSAAAS